MEETKTKTRPAGRREASQNRRTHNVLLAGAFLLVAVLCFIINLAVKDREFSDTENRNLAQKPALSAAALADGSYFSGVTSWYNDQFFARDGWMSLSLRENKLLGRKEAGGVFLGRNNRLFGKPETPDEAALAETVAAVNTFAGEHPDITMQMLLVPDAASIMTAELPKNAPVRDQLADISGVLGQLGGVEPLSASDVLQSHAEEELYYKTDHHWTSLGAYYVFAANTSALGIENPASDYDIYTVTTEFEGTLASKSGSHGAKDSIQVYAPKDIDVLYYLTKGSDTEKLTSIYSSAALDVKDKYTVFFGGNYDIIDIRTTADNGRSLLVFKDSYANCFMQFLVPYYERIIMIDPRYYYGSLDSVLNYGITDVLFLYSADTFLTDTSLKDVLAAGSSKAEELPDSVTDAAGTEPASPPAAETPAPEEPAEAEETEESSDAEDSGAETDAETDIDA